MKPHRFYLVFRFQFSALILLRRLFFLAARQSLQAASALAPLRQFRFHTPSENRKTKSFPLSVFRFPLSPRSPPAA